MGRGYRHILCTTALGCALSSGSLAAAQKIIAPEPHEPTGSDPNPTTFCGPAVHAVVRDPVAVVEEVQVLRVLVDDQHDLDPPQGPPQRPRGLTHEDL